MRDLLFYDKRRFADFLSSPERIATNILAERLQRLERAGIVETTLYSEHPPRAEYHLTEKGRELGDVVDAMAAWGLRHLPGTRLRTAG